MLCLWSKQYINETFVALFLGILSPLHHAQTLSHSFQSLVYTILFGKATSLSTNSTKPLFNTSLDILVQTNPSI